MLKKAKRDDGARERAELYAGVADHNARADALRSVVTAAEHVCKLLEHPTASVTINDQVRLRAALDQYARCR